MSLPAADNAYEKAVAAQAAFRAVMSAMARPGTAYGLAATAAPSPLSPAAATFAATMCDHETPVWLDAALASDPVAHWLRFHTGASVVPDPQRAAFALIGDPANLVPLAAFNTGTQEYPDRSTTLVLQVESLNRGTSLTLSGPGIDGRAAFCASPLPDDMRQRLTINRGLFPRGLDFVFVTETEIAAIPRSARIAVEGH